MHCISKKISYFIKRLGKYACAYISTKKPQRRRILMKKKLFTFILVQLIAFSIYAEVRGRYIRIFNPGKKILSLAEVQVLALGKNIAFHKKAVQTSIEFDGVAKRAVDGHTNGDFFRKSVTHTAIGDSNPTWEVDLQASVDIKKIIVWNRTDTVSERIIGTVVMILDENRKVVWARKITKNEPKIVFNLIAPPLQGYLGKVMPKVHVKEVAKK
jgi:hypothetical protein